MRTANTILRTPEPFNLWSTAWISGWGDLAPFYIDLKGRTVARILGLNSGDTVRSVWSQVDGSRVKVHLESERRLSSDEIMEAKAQVASCLRLDEGYSEFYALCSKDDQFHWVRKLAAGRLLRAPTVFEDVVKTLCTTNCTWAFTTVMAANLCRALGTSFDSGLHAFPTPAQMARTTVSHLRRNARTGYRSPYLLNLARRVATGELSLEEWRKTDRTTEQLRTEIQAVQGIGPYGTAYILNWVGRFECLTIDRWMRKKFYEKHCGGKPVSDDVITEHYEKFGKWSGLFFWVDMTREWLAP